LHQACAPRAGRLRRISSYLQQHAALETKNPERRAARAGWRSFAEYIFLEDSRYASQRENLARKQIRPHPPESSSAKADDPVIAGLNEGGPATLVAPPG